MLEANKMKIEEKYNKWRRVQILDLIMTCNSIDTLLRRGEVEKVNKILDKNLLS